MRGGGPLLCKPYPWEPCMLCASNVRQRINKIKWMSKHLHLFNRTVRTPPPKNPAMPPISLSSSAQLSSHVQHINCHPEHTHYYCLSTHDYVKLCAITFNFCHNSLKQQTMLFTPTPRNAPRTENHVKIQRH